MLAHGALLRKNFFSAAELIAIVADFRNASLPAEEVALMSFAQKVILQAQQMSDADMNELRGFGFSDVEILNVILASAARGFFSKTLDSVGAVPDEVYKELEPELRQVLALGRPFP
jgi:alkylhydroperoxidase family enzyme